MVSAGNRGGGLFVFSAVLFILALGAVEEHVPGGPLYDIGDFTVTVDTEKDVYGSQELVRMSVVVDSPADLAGATISVQGIRPGNYAHINQTRPVELKGGENRFILIGRTPYCTSGCGGVYPGPYEVTAELAIGGWAVSNSTTITLVSG
jgi:hypothetical protein